MVSMTKSIFLVILAVSSLFAVIAATAAGGASGLASWGSAGALFPRQDEWEGAKPFQKDGEEQSAPPQHGDLGQAGIWNMCDFPVYVNMVPGAAPGNPPPMETYAVIKPGGRRSYGYDFAPGIGASIKVTREEGSNSIAQFELTWDALDGKVWYDLSHVNVGIEAPFFKEGVHIFPFGPESSKFGNCRMAGSAAGEECDPKDTYCKADDDRAMHDCGDKSDLVMVTCSGNGQEVTKAWEEARNQLMKAKMAAHNAASALKLDGSKVAFSAGVALVVVDSGIWLLG